MNQSKRYQVANICYAIVGGNFAMFCKADNRGANFKWENFASMQEKHCALHVWMHMPIPKDPKIKKEIEETASNFGREIAENLVNRAEFVTKESADNE